MRYAFRDSEQSLECDRVGGINLSQGVCDTEIPMPVRRAAQAAIDAGPNTYTHHIGIPELRRLLARKIETYAGLNVDPDTELVVTAGSTGAFYSACMALMDPGDEVILFEPFYGYHLSTITATGLKPRFVAMSPPNWTFRVEDLEAACGSRTRGIMICTRETLRVRYSAKRNWKLSRVLPTVMTCSYSPTKYTSTSCMTAASISAPRLCLD